MVAKAVQVGALAFPTKQSAEEYFREILYRYEFGQLLDEPDTTAVAWLLERHPELPLKVGVGIQAFSVRSAIYGSRCFELIRIDGTRTDFSFKSCVDGKAPSPVAQVLTALRAEVASDILDKKREWFVQNADSEGRVACAISAVLVSFDESHADHAPPRSFGTLAIAFLAARQIEPTLGLVTPPADNQYQPTLADRALASDWVAYHHRLAVIRVVARDVNLRNAHLGKVREKDRQLRMS